MGYQKIRVTPDSGSRPRSARVWIHTPYGSLLESYLEIKDGDFVELSALDSALRLIDPESLTASQLRQLEKLKLLNARR